MAKIMCIRSVFIVMLGLILFMDMVQFGLCAAAQTNSSGAENSGIPIGSIQAFAGKQVPKGWLLCDGSALNRQEYPSLFDVIDVIYGEGDGVSTFKLPDLRGRVIVGSGQGVGLTNRRLAESFGLEQHTLSVNEIPSHSHGVNDPGHQHDIGDGITGQIWGINDGGPKGVFGKNYRDFHNNPPTVRAYSGISIQATGSNAPHNNIQPSLVINYIIKH